jgi:2-alkenal reductase
VAGIESTLENIYARVDPAVVNIGVIQNQGAGFPGVPSAALGSGFLWDKTGNIVTNNHVIADADNITVTFYDGTAVPGKVIGADADSDLAVVKVDMPALQIEPVQVADSSALKVGQLAIAIGNPFGLEGTMTVGIVSGLGRLISANQNAVGPSYSIPDIVQTDAAVNPGNSGGVLLDASGKLIGVTNSISTTTGTSQGVGFAIPSAIVQQVVPALITSGHYDHPYLGTSILSMNPDLASAMNLPANQRGALIESVTAGSPAEKAGLQAGKDSVTINGQQILVGGDVVIAYNGQTVKSSDDLITFLARSGVAGQKVTLTVLRDGKQIQVEVTLGVRPTS